MQILILLSAMLASLTGLVVGERPVARAQVERSVAQPAAQGASAARARAERPAESVRTGPACASQSRAETETPPRRKARSILLLKRAWLE